MCNDGAVAAKGLVAACVIAVPVCIENESRLVAAEFAQGVANLVGQRRELIVNDQDAIRTDGNADVSAAAFKHVHVARDMRRLDLDLGKILLCMSGYDQNKAHGDGNTNERTQHRQLLFLCGDPAQTVARILAFLKVVKRQEEFNHAPGSRRSQSSRSVTNM